MLVVFCLGHVLSGCGGEDTPDHLDFTLPTFKFTVSSASQQWRTAPPGGIPNKVCAGPEAVSTDCCSSAFADPPIDCQQYPVACNPDDNYCALVFDVEDSVDADLATDVSEIAAVQGRVFASVSLLSLTTTVSGLGQLPIRSANLYVAPGDSESASSPGAALALAHQPHLGLECHRARLGCAAGILEFRQKLPGPVLAGAFSPFHNPRLLRTHRLRRLHRERESAGVLLDFLITSVTRSLRVARNRALKAARCFGWLDFLGFCANC